MNALIDMGHRELVSSIFLGLIDGLHRMTNNIPSDLFSLAEYCLEHDSRIVVCGVGKSGIVGRKLTATLVSTGSKSLFLHAGEASHGDLGFICDDDVVIFISNSGETPELQAVIEFCEKRNIKFAGISSRADSSLQSRATYALTIPECKEAGPYSVAPTTSTSLTLALGDGLAMLLMHMRKFTTKEFREFHPGGNLGVRLSSIESVMRKGPDLCVVSPEVKMEDVILQMTGGAGYGVAFVVREMVGLIGVITDGDLRRHIHEIAHKTAGEICSKNPVTVYIDDSIETACRVMQEKKIYSLGVLDLNNILVGHLRMHDVIVATGP